MRGSYASFSSKVIFLKLETMVSPVIRYVDVRKTVGDFHIRSRPEESPRLQSVGLCCVPNLQKQRRRMSLTETCSTLILKFLFNNVYKSCSVSFYKMQCFYAAALTDIKWMCSVSIFRSMSKWNLYYQNNVNHLKPTEPYKLLPYYTTAACSNAEQEWASARGLFLRWNCQKQKSPKQNNPKPKTLFGIFAFDYTDRNDLNL